MVSNVDYKFDKEKDLHNVWATCNWNSKWFDFASRMPPQLVKKLKGKEFAACQDTLREYSKKVYNPKMIKISENAVNQSWRLIEKKYFDRLEKITGRPFVNKKIKAYLTTVPRCPYNTEDNWFMVNYFSSIPQMLATSGHEIMHLHFHQNYWESMEKKIGDKTGELKESLTVLLNLEFNDLWFVGDKGYDSHQKLRSFIIKQWEKNKDFDVLLDKCVHYIRRGSNGK